MSKLLLHFFTPNPLNEALLLLLVKIPLRKFRGISANLRAQSVTDETKNNSVGIFYL